MENILSILLDNRSWLLSGLTVASISIFANVVTRFFLSKSKRDVNVVVRIMSKDGKEFKIELNDYDSEEKVAEAIRNIRGSDFVDPTSNESVN